MQFDIRNKSIDTEMNAEIFAQQLLQKFDDIIIQISNDPTYLEKQFASTPKSSRNHNEENSSMAIVPAPERTPHEKRLPGEDLPTYMARLQKEHEERIERMRQEKTQKELATIRSTPQINSRSRQLAARRTHGRGLMDPERISEAARKKTSHHKKIQSALEEKELQELRDKPKINKDSKKLNRSVNSMYEWASKREEKLEKLRQERLAQEKAELKPVIRTSKGSRRWLERSQRRQKQKNESLNNSYQSSVSNEEEQAQFHDRSSSCELHYDDLQALSTHSDQNVSHTNDSTANVSSNVKEVGSRLYLLAQERERKLEAKRQKEEMKVRMAANPQLYLPHSRSQSVQKKRSNDDSSSRTELLNASNVSTRSRSRSSIRSNNRSRSTSHSSSTLPQTSIESKSSVPGNRLYHQGIHALRKRSERLQSERAYHETHDENGNRLFQPITNRMKHTKNSKQPTHSDREIIQTNQETNCVPVSHKQTTLSMPNSKPITNETMDANKQQNNRSNVDTKIPTLEKSTKTTTTTTTPRSMNASTFSMRDFIARARAHEKQTVLQGSSKVRNHTNDSNEKSNKKELDIEKPPVMPPQTNASSHHDSHTTSSGISNATNAITIPNLPNEWITQYTKDGELYYYNTIKKIYTWQHPSEESLPDRSSTETSRTMDARNVATNSNSIQISHDSNSTRKSNIQEHETEKRDDDDDDDDDDDALLRAAGGSFLERFRRNSKL